MLMLRIVPFSLAETWTMNLVGLSEEGSGMLTPPPVSCGGKAMAIWASVGEGWNVMMKNESNWNDISSIGVMGRSGSTWSVVMRLLAMNVISKFRRLSIK